MSSSHRSFAWWNSPYERDCVTAFELIQSGGKGFSAITDPSWVAPEPKRHYNPPPPERWSHGIVDDSEER